MSDDDVIYEREEAEPRQALFERRKPRGKSTWKYTRLTVATATGMKVAGVRAAEKRGELDMEDIKSVALFIGKRCRPT